MQVGGALRGMRNNPKKIQPIADLHFTEQEKVPEWFLQRIVEQVQYQPTTVWSTSLGRSVMQRRKEKYLQQQHIEDMRKIQCPIIRINGREDNIVLSKDMDELESILKAGILQSPYFKHHKIDNAKHAPYIGKYEEYKQILHYELSKI